jgi:hypothetical protein
VLKKRWGLQIVDLGTVVQEFWTRWGAQNEWHRRTSGVYRIVTMPYVIRVVRLDNIPPAQPFTFQRDGVLIDYTLAPAGVDC